jgi:acyl-CoA thioesterase-1
VTGTGARRVRCGGPAALAFVLLAACGGEPDLAPLPAGAVILAFGDSITHGTGARDGESYPEVLARRTGRTVVNAGVPGEITAQGLRRLPGVLGEVRPALVILCHGGNDILRKRPPGEAARNLREMIRLSRAAGAQVVLLGVPRFGLLLDSADFYREVAAQEGVPLEADILPDVLSDNALKSDAVHPNAAGYERLAQAVEALLRERGAL